MRVVFDSNVWVAALVAQGICRDVVEEAFLAAEVYISPVILKEIDQVLAKKFEETSKERLQVREWLKEVCRVVDPSPREGVFCRDRKDLPILWLSLFVHADFLVTGDQDLLDLKEVQGIQIIPPSLFWRSLER